MVIFHLGCPGPVSCMKWTPDGTALVMAWERGGFSIWSTFGAMIMCSLCWDYGPLVSIYKFLENLKLYRLRTDRFNFHL